MAVLTVSTDGTSDGNECHAAEKVSARTTWGEDRPRYGVTLALSTEQGLAIAYDLLYQAVDAGVLAGWSVQFPEPKAVDAFSRAVAEEAAARASRGVAVSTEGGAR